MGDMRDRNALLSQDEIEAIKVCQGIINRMAENSAKAKNLFFTISAAFGAGKACRVRLETRHGGFRLAD